VEEKNICARQRKGRGLTVFFGLQQINIGKEEETEGTRGFGGRKMAE